VCGINDPGHTCGEYLVLLTKSRMTGHLEEGKTAKPTNGKKSGKPKKKSKEKLKLKTPPNTLNISSPP
jgi:hypothetical protein